MLHPQHVHSFLSDVATAPVCLDRWCTQSTDVPLRCKAVCACCHTDLVHAKHASSVALAQCEAAQVWSHASNLRARNVS